MRKTIGTTCVAVMALSWASGAAAQGLYWESTTSGIGNQTRTAQFYAMPKMMKVVHSDGPVTVLRSDQDKIITIDPKHQTYEEMKLAELATAGTAAQAQMEAAHAQMEARMKELPPEQRAMMEKMMPNLPGAGGAKTAPVNVRNTGETKTINGYSCAKYVASQGDRTLLVAWVTKDVKGFDGLHDDWVKFQKRMAAATPMGGQGGIGEAYAQLDGFPLETEMGNVKTTVTKIESRTTPASEFAVPAGYKLEPAHLPHGPGH